MAGVRVIVNIRAVSSVTFVDSSEIITGFSAKLTEKAEYVLNLFHIIFYIIFYSMEDGHMLDKSSAIPLYAQLAEQLRLQIDSGQLRPGEQLPSESEMMARYQIGRPTVRAALKQLVSAGYLTKIQGKGTFCRDLHAGKPINIEVLLDMENEYFIPYYVRAISGVLKENNCNFLISNTNRDAQSICEQLENSLQKDTSGVILQMTPVNIRPELRQRLLHCIAAFRRRSIPVILIDSLLEGADVSYCVINERGGGARAAEHLAAYGHRRCAMVSPSDFCDAVQRYEGFCRAAEQFGMAPPVLVDADSELERTLPAAVRAAQVTGLFCYNDALAQRCIRILRSADYRIPAQISVIGFDDSFLAASIEPPLTTLCHPKEELGRCTASALLKLIQNEIPWPFQKIFDVPLIQRATCARCQPLCAAKPE